MKTAGVIAEFNPFHNGHKYLLDVIKKEYGYDRIIVIMSGDYVQRGYPALIGKFERAKAALLCGADLVIELPVIYATGSAEYFAEGAVKLLNALCPTADLIFGCEEGNTILLNKFSKLLSNETPSLSSEIKSLMEKGFSYPSARMLALKSLGLLSEEEVSKLSLPNNILGAEYIRAIKRNNLTLTPIGIKRTGSEYNSTLLSQMCSAAAIRNSIECGDLSSAEESMPRSSFEILKTEIEKRRFVKPDDLSLLLYYAVQKEDNLCRFLDISSDLSNRITGLINSFESFTKFAESLKSKNYTLTRINRSLLHIILGIEENEKGSFISVSPGYARILGLNKASGDFMKNLKMNATIPLIAKPADYKPADSDSKYMIEKDYNASDLYNRIIAGRSGTNLLPDIASTPVIIANS